MLLWTWDKNKEQRNIRSHGISFETAVHVFDDPLAITNADPFWDELRWRTMGTIGVNIVVVIHTMPEIDHTGRELGRIISARKATKLERRIYENER